MDTPKPIEARLKECMSILKKLTESLHLPSQSPEIVELRSRMNDYIKTGEPWTGEVEFLSWDRIAQCNFPKMASKTVEVTLKHISKM